MKRNEFNNVISTLKKYYEKELSPEIEDIYFNEMKYYNGDLSKYIETIFADNKYFPKIADLKSANKEIRNSIKTLDINEKVCDCEFCRGTGYRFIDQKNEAGNIYTFAVACDCSNGDSKLYDGRTLKDEQHRSSYICPRYSSIIPF